MGIAGIANHVLYVSFFGSGSGGGWFEWLGTVINLLYQSTDTSVQLRLQYGVKLNVRLGVPGLNQFDI